MKLSFLIQLVLLLLLVISVYMVFTNSVGGRMKLILIVFCVVLGLYLFSKLNVFKNYNEFLSTPTSAREKYTIESKELKKSEGNFTISTWIFIDDWNYRYGKKKDILKKKINGNNIPYIGLDHHKNDLIIEVNGYNNPDSTIESFCNLMKSSNIEGFSNVDYFTTILTELKDADLNTFIDSIQDLDENVKDTGLTNLLRSLEDMDDSDTMDSLINALNELDDDNFLTDFIQKLDDISSSDTALQRLLTAFNILNKVSPEETDTISLEPITIKNIPMQKWVNIITSIGNNTIDVYINGKLVKTTTYNNVIDTNAINDGKIIVADNDGFGGFVSRIRYLSYFITPEEAWSIYTDGFGDAFESALNKYNMSLSFYQDSIEQNKFFLF